MSGSDASVQGGPWRVYPAGWARWLVTLAFSVTGLVIATGVRIAQDVPTVVLVLLMTAGCCWGAWRSATMSVSDDGAHLVIRNWERTRRLRWDEILELTDGKGDSGAWIIAAQTRAGARVKIRISQHARVARLVIERAAMHGVPTHFSPHAKPRSPLGNRAYDQVVLDGIHQLIKIANERPNLDNVELVDALVSSGVDRDSANRLVVFVPIALGRYLIDALGVQSDPTYYRELEDGTRQGPFDLMDRAEFRVAMEHRDHVLSLAGSKALATRSWEVQAVNQLLNDGLDITGSTLSPAHIS